MQEFQSACMFHNWLLIATVEKELFLFNFLIGKNNISLRDYI